MQQVYLTRRNLLTLLNKLDRVDKGGQSELTLVKRDTEHKKYPCSDVIYVTAVEDDDYYTDRKPGFVLEADEPKDEDLDVLAFDVAFGIGPDEIE